METTHPTTPVSNTKDQSRLQYGDFYRHHQRWTNQFYPYFGEPPSQKPYGERGQLDPELMAVIVQTRRSFA